MEIKVIGTSHAGYAAPKEEFDAFGGHAAGVCYMAGDFDALLNEAPEKTARRVKQTKESGHHSVYDHVFINMYLDKIPRILEIMLDNERFMVSSVKSGRYTLHPLPDDEQKLYDKWLARFQDLIRAEYAEKTPNFFTENKIKKLAMENARYLTSIFTRVSMIHTVSYRQFNYIYGFLKGFLEKDSESKFVSAIKPFVCEFLTQMEATGYVDEGLTDTGKSRGLSLFGEPVEEYFGDVYAANYRCSFTCYAHLNRHRTLKYRLRETQDIVWFIPEIIQDNEELVREWNEDLNSLADNFPQARIFEVSEMGNYDDFILKVIERKCSCVQLETTRVVNDIIKKYAEVKPDLAKMLKGARCTFGYKCPSPCGWVEAIKETRKV
ncbi:MAG: FAD-dependent thymidylate synthase [Christensenellaceae bacterium]|jgi:hypothetical protein|nr:FAD-dependent thymidylate synthase [Christensenellaceae bacterium]